MCIKREQNCAICIDVFGPRDCHAERSMIEENKYCILMPICGT